MASITLNNVSVEFPIYHLNARSIKKQFLRIGTGGRLLNTENQVIVKALDRISFQLQHGDRLGIIGHNGAGKSTLLRVLSRIYEPTEGYLNIEGKISPLLDISVGIDADLTGYENIILRGTLLGLTRQEISAKADEIAAFTGLGDYLSMPIRTYSSGMRLRLAFGVATSIAPEILILDEVVGAGDTSFLNQAKKRMQDLITQSSIVVLASHSTEILKEICNKILWLEVGRVRFFGELQRGLHLYRDSISGRGLNANKATPLR